MAAPRTVWRIRLQDGSVVHCVLWERRLKTAVVWYRDDEVQGVEEFLDPAEAEDWAAELRGRVAVDRAWRYVSKITLQVVARMLYHVYESGRSSSADR